MLLRIQSFAVVLSLTACTSAYCQEMKADAEVSETSALKIAKVLGDDALPVVRWVENERLRACCYGIGIGSMPKLEFRPHAQEAKQQPPQKMTLQGENFLRVHVPQGEKLEFRITARAADSLFTDSTYAVFDQAGKHVADGIVKLGESQDVAIPVENEGLYLVLLNSGPASDNTFELKILNHSWIIDGRGRGAYLRTPVFTNSLRDLSLAGFNTAFLGLEQANLSG